jgi:hypothetical protein
MTAISWRIPVRGRSFCAKAQKQCGTAATEALVSSGSLEHLGSRFDNVLDRPIDGEGREGFAHGAFHSGNFVAEPF